MRDFANDATVFLPGSAEGPNSETGDYYVTAANAAGLVDERSTRQRFGLRTQKSPA
jgi:hypothetical protein